jgi:hypothetical protein
MIRFSVQGIFGQKQQRVLTLSGNLKLHFIKPEYVHSTNYRDHRILLRNHCRCIVNGDSVPDRGR